MSELKPCPFCGGEAEIMEYSDRFQCGCKDEDCIAWVEEMPVYLTRSGAIKDWNRRAERTCQFFYDKKMAEYACSACGERVSGTNPDDEYEVTPLAVLESFEFCPRCGAKVIEE